MVRFDAHLELGIFLSKVIGDFFLNCGFIPSNSLIFLGSGQSFLESLNLTLNLSYILVRLMIRSLQGLLQFLLFAEIAALFLGQGPFQDFILSLQLDLLVQRNPENVL